MNQNFPTLLKGLAMGIAEVIPGVSGGTIAFITGIYERLLSAIGSFGPKLFKDYKEGGIGAVWKAIDGTFLAFLLGGMATGVVIGIFTITHLLETHPEPLWGFFFGLILASALVLRKEIGKLDVRTVIWLIVGAIIAFVITIVSPRDGSDSYIYLFFCGILAISALMLPGISGSFVLLLLGMYTVVITAVKTFLSSFDFSVLPIVVVFALGCLTGLFSFAKVLTWLFSKYRTQTFAAMVGFLLGSLNKIWPWRNITLISEKISGQITKITDPAQLTSLDPESFKILAEQNVLPSAYTMADPKTLLTAVSLIIGFVLVSLLDKYDTKDGK
jgi:putative membrane protein